MTTPKDEINAATGPPPAVKGVVIGFGVVALLTVPKLVFREELGEPAPFLLYFAAVLVAAWYGGAWAGTLTTVAAALTAWILFIEPTRSLQTHMLPGLTRLGIFIVEGVSIAIVTGRLRAERERALASEVRLRLTNDQLGVVLSGVSDGITVQDASGAVIYANEPAAQLVGFESVEAFLAADQASLIARFDLVDESGESMSATALPSRLALDGERRDALIGFTTAGSPRRWSEVTANPVREPDGRVAHIVNVFRDVTEARQHEMALRVSHAWFSTALHSIGDGVIATDAKGVITLMNPVAEELTGWPLEEAKGRRLDTVFHILDEGSREIVENPVERVIREGVVVGLTSHTILVKKDRAEIAIDDSAAPIRDGQGVLVGVVLVFRDVSKKRRAEAAREFLARVAAELDTSLDYRTTLASIARLACPTVADWCAVDVEENGRLQRLAVAHVEPEKLEFVRAIEAEYPADQDSNNIALAVFRSGTPQMMRDIPDELIVASSKDARHLELLRALGLRSFICVPLRNGKQTIGVISFVMAESNRRYDEEDLAFAVTLADRASVAAENALLFREVERSSRSKDEFLAMLGHELRNPLAPIRSALDLMNQKAGDLLLHERVVIDRQLVHMLRLVDDLLDVSRITRGEIELSRSPLALDVVVEHSIEMASRLIEDRGVTVHLDVAPSLMVDGDVARLAQVVTNLVNNAANYGHHHGSIWITARREGDHHRLSVRDDGIGVSAELVPRMFELFSQETQGIDRARGGLGLGLAIVKRIVEAHGGHVEAMSEGLGKGTEVVVTLPVLEGDGSADSLKKAVDPSTDPNGQPLPTPKRVLVVDDNEDALELLLELMTRRGYDAVGAPDAYVALELAATTPPWLALVDIGLPGMDGYQLGKALRQVESCKDVLLIAITGYGQRSDRERSSEAGFDAHLVKPVEIKHIEEAVRLLDKERRDGP